MESWRIVVEVIGDGVNIYVGSDRYNYGPIWSQILHVLFEFSGRNFDVYRYTIAEFLSLADVGICLILWRRFGLAAAALFFLNPISIMVTAFQCQMDNVAILLGLGGMLLMGDRFDRPMDREKMAGLALLGLSLSIKHVLFAFPCWLALKQRGMCNKLLTLGIPFGFFALLFAPSWENQTVGGRIILNVFRYPFYYSNNFYDKYVPAILQTFCSSLGVFLFCLALAGFLFRKHDAIRSLLVYTCVLVATSPASSPQYFAIPVAFAATHLNAFSLLYTLAGSHYLYAHPDGLHYPALVDFGSIHLLVFLLVGAFVWESGRDGMIRALRWAWHEIKVQCGGREAPPPAVTGDS